MRRALRRTIPLVVPLLAVAMTAESAAAQYFGRNKVQYRTFDFRVLQTETFDVYFYPEEETAARDAARMAERWYTRLSGILDHRFGERQPLIFYGSHPAFQQTTTVGGDVGEGTGGVTESAQQRVIMPLTGSYAETDHVLGHELVHAFQYDISGLGRSRGQVGASGRALGSAPLWFIEGMAEYLSVGPVHPLTAMWIRDAALSGDIPTLRQLSVDPRIYPYRWGHALWAYVGGRWGDAAIGQILRTVGEGVPYNDAMERVLNIELEELSQDWHTAIRRTYLPMLAERPEAREVAEPLITREREGGRLNIGPALSPDGEWVVFLSERELDVELWLANARTGEVVRRLRSGTAFDPHFQSLRYINSAGSWAPDNRQFVFSALRGGQDRLVIIDTRNARTISEIEIPGVIEIGTPSWSPDGRTIVFSGISGGVSDLYAYDLQTEQTTQLTDDLFANLHPSVSPDGQTVAFVTDQGPGTDLANLQYGGYNLALLDIRTRQVTLLPVASGDGDDINPSWGRDGGEIYFISNRFGIPNVYRLTLPDRQIFQVTRLFGGVSGITDTSPALTVARTADRLLFSAFEENGYNIYALTGTQEMAGTAVSPEELAPGRVPLPAVLPPSPRPAEAPFNRVTIYLEDPTTGLPSATRVAGWEVRPYSPGLGLDYLGQPTVGYSTGGVLGMGGLYGGITAVFSDVLGYHTVFGTLQAQGELDEIGFSTAYINQKHRWNWGAVAQRIPYIVAATGGRSVEPLPENPNLALFRDRIYRLRTFNTSLGGIAQYPFSPAQRIEFNGGLRRVARDVQVIELQTVVDPNSGQVVGQNVERFDSAGVAWNLVEASTALVYDNALFGYTSPFAGQRYRFEITPTVGQLTFVQALADYRRYLFRRPFTLAVQGLHFGRYGTDAENDTAFYPIFLGQPSLVRGYYGTYTECYRNPADCENDVLENLIGSRIAVAKVEARFPLIRQLVIGPIPFPPIEGFLFGDAGLAWNQQTSPSFRRLPEGELLERDPATGALLDDTRYLLTSAGVGGRINLFGYAIVEINYVNAFQRDLGWHWQFALQPGF